MIASEDLAVLRGLAHRYLELPAPHGRAVVPIHAVTAWLSSEPFGWRDAVWASLVRLRACTLTTHGGGGTIVWGPITEVVAFGGTLHVTLHPRLLAQLDGRHADEAIASLLHAIAERYRVEVPA